MRRLSVETGEPCRFPARRPETRAYASHRGNAGVVLVLETGNQVVGVPHDDHVAGGLAPSPACGPQIEAVMQVDIGKER
jgi:hypothetical protein